MPKQTPADTESDAFLNAADLAAIGNAVDGTSHEIFNAGFGKEDDDGVEDDSGDTSLEAMGEGLEGDHLPDDGEEGEGEDDADTGEKAETEGEPEKPGEKREIEAQPEVDAQGRIPPAVHRKALERARAAEAERDTGKQRLDALQGKFDSLSAKLDGLITGLARPAPKGEADAKAAEPPPIPDVFENPQGFADHLTRSFDARLQPVLQAIENNRVETSMGNAHARHGEVFEKAMEAVGKLNPANADDVATVQRITRSPNPGEALVSWHKRNETLALVGNDPAKWAETERAKLRDALVKDPELRKQIIAELQAEAEGNGTGRPNTTIKLPRSLNGARGGAARGDDLAGISDLGDQQGIWDSAWR